MSDNMTQTIPSHLPPEEIERRVENFRLLIEHGLHRYVYAFNDIAEALESVVPALNDAARNNAVVSAALAKQRSRELTTFLYLLAAPSVDIPFSDSFQQITGDFWKAMLSERIIPLKQKECGMLRMAFGDLFPALVSLNITWPAFALRHKGDADTVSAIVWTVVENALWSFIDLVRPKRARIHVSFHETVFMGRPFQGIRVYDNGKGIAANRLEMLQAKFIAAHDLYHWHELPLKSRTMPSDKGAGHLGVSLIVAERYLHTIGGRMEIKSREGNGTRVTLWFPYM